MARKVCCPGQKPLVRSPKQIWGGSSLIVIQTNPNDLGMWALWGLTQNKDTSLEPDLGGEFDANCLVARSWVRLPGGRQGRDPG